MSGMADYSFAEWAQAFPFKESEPMRRESLSPDTCFIRVSTTSPLPMAAHWETWEWTDEADELLGYTANVVLPDLIATWFFEQSEGDRLPSREYLSLARKHGSLVRDIPVVEDALAILDLVLLSNVGWLCISLSWSQLSVSSSRMRSPSARLNISAG